MTDWKEVALGDVAHVSWGDTTKTKAAYVDEGVLAYSASGPDGFLPVADHVGDGVVISAIGAQCGKTWFAHGEWSCIKNTIWFQGCEGVSTRFLYYATANPSLWPRRGAAQPFIGLGDAKAMRLSIPQLADQLQIGSVLGSIDDLIENNRRRVEVLEEMARAIYREWFVHFRFPGHEHATFVESDLGPIPEGWVIRPLGAVMTLNYGKALRQPDRRGGSVAVLGSAGVVGWHDEAIVNGPAIVLGRKGNVGSVTWVDGNAWPIDTTYFVETKLPLRYVAEQLRGITFLNTHAAVPGLSRDQAYSKPFLVPDDYMMERFATTSGVLLGDASCHREQGRSLVAIRDMLLPKLVTGQIDITDLDLDAAMEQAGV